MLVLYFAEHPSPRSGGLRGDAYVPASRFRSSAWAARRLRGTVPAPRNGFRPGASASVNRYAAPTVKPVQAEIVARGGNGTA